MLAKWTRLSSRYLCSNQWIKVRDDTVLQPDGVVLPSYMVIEYPGAVAILFVHEGKLLLVKQYRYAIGEFTWEIPSGARIGSEPIVESASRELYEETGYEASELIPFYEFYPSPGSSNEVISVILAKGVKTKGEIEEPVALFEKRWSPLPEVIKLVMAGEIKHGPTVIALFVAAHKGLIELPGIK